VIVAFETEEFSFEEENKVFSLPVDLCDYLGWKKVSEGWKAL
jgi:hypothetical protein